MINHNTATNTEDVLKAIQDNALGPRKATGDSGSIEQHSIRDQIDADRYLKSQSATKNKHRGLQINKLVPPGSM